MLQRQMIIRVNDPKNQINEGKSWKKERKIFKIFPIFLMNLGNLIFNNHLIKICS